MGHNYYTKTITNQKKIHGINFVLLDKKNYVTLVLIIKQTTICGHRWCKFDDNNSVNN